MKRQHIRSYRLVVFAVSLLGMMLCAVVVPARTIVVSPLGNDINIGTAQQPYETLAKANAVVQPGDTVLVRGGTYHETLSPARQGTPGAQIVYLAAPGETVVIDGLPNELILSWIGSYTTIEGFNFKSQAYFNVPNSRDYWVNLYGSHINMRRCRLVADGDPAYNQWTLKAVSRGVAVSGQFVTIENCFIRGHQLGVELTGGTPRFYTMRYDTILSVGASNIVITSPNDGRTIDSTMQGNLIEYCVLDTSWEEDNIQFEPCYVDHSKLCNRGTIIRRCRLGNAAENAVDLKGAMQILLDENLIYSSQGDNDGLMDGGDDVGGAGINMGYGDVSRYVILRRNVLWDNHTGAFMYDGYHYYGNIFLNNRRSYRGPNGDYAGNDFAGVTTWTMPGYRRAFVNNIVGDQPNKGVFYWLMDYGAKFYVNSNMYFETGGQPKFYHRVSGNILTTVGLTDWRSILTSYSGYAYLGGKDEKSIEANPQFVNVPPFPVGYDPSWNFSLRPGSPGINAGQSVTFAIQGETESTTLLVDDPWFFCDGYGTAEGDSLRIGNTAPVQIRSIDYGTGLIELAEPRTWSPGEGVHIAYGGSAPDIGAVEIAGQVVVNPPGVPQLLAPVDGAGNLAGDVMLSWSRIQDAATYAVQVSISSAFASPVVSSLGRTDTAFLVQGLLGGTGYFWRVRSSNNNGVSAWSLPRSFSTALSGTAISPPSPSSPVNGASGVSTNPSVSWFALPGAISYRVQVATNGAFTALLLDLPDLTTTSVLLDGLKSGTTYYWRVNAAGATSTSGWSDVAIFTTFTFPETFSQNAVTNAIFDNGTAGWSFYTNGSGAFSVGAPGFRKATAGKVFVSRGGTNIQLYQTGIVLSPDSTYRLRFAASSSSGNDMDVSLRKHVAPYTSYGVESYRVDLTPLWKIYSIDFKPENFSTAVNDVRLALTFDKYAAAGDVYSIDYVKLTPIDALHPPPPDDVPADYYLEGNYPNPFNSATTIRYGLPADVHVIIKIYNLLGQEVLTLVDGIQLAGVYEVRLDMHRYSSGMYLCVFQGGDYRQTRKLMYVK